MEKERILDFYQFDWLNGARLSAHCSKALDFLGRQETGVEIEIEVVSIQFFWDHT